MTLDYYYKNEQIGQFHFFRMPKILMKETCFKELSSDAKLLYTLMLDRMCLSLKNGWIDNEDKVYIYYTINEIMEELGCSSTTCTKILCELDSKKGVGLIERKRQGQGKPDRIYVKNLVESTLESKEVVSDKNETTTYNEKCAELTANEKTMPISETKKLPVQKQEIHVSKIKESTIQDTKKFRPNNNYINNTKWSNNESIYLSVKEEMDWIEEQKQLIREKRFVLVDAIFFMRSQNRNF